MEVIPFEPASLRGERLLVLAPHPDDEVIGCGGLVAQHLRDGRPVHIMVATDGTEAEAAIADRGAYRAMREEESRRALAVLGGSPPIEFLRFSDRHLAENTDELQTHLSRHLRETKPDLILAPSPVEIHPDHLALARAFCELVQRDESLFAELAIARVAFYEVSQPLRPNAIVDISDVADAKYAAIAEHQSQVAIRDYSAFARGLNAYRAMTLPPQTTYAEGYFVTELSRLRTTPFTALQSQAGQARIAIEVDRAVLPISVVIRTKSRPALLGEALASVRATGYPTEIVVVNDGGTRPDLDGVKLVEHTESRGRSEAMNSGVRAASSAFIAFLDDDDLFYPEHLDTLARAARSHHAAWYSEAVSSFLGVGESGTYETRSKQRLVGGDFDRDLLLVDNYIPLPTLLMRRGDFLDLGGFDPSFDLFEDWDFLIRLSRRGDFLHVPRITCEIRHIEGGGSIVMSSPEGSERFREAKLQVWRKHAGLIDNHVIANSLERQKRRLQRMQTDLVEAQGLRHHLETNVARLDREKQQLIREIQSLHESLNAHAVRLRELEGVHEALARAQVENEKKAVEIVLLRQHNEELKKAHEEAQTAIPALYAEIHRLQGLLDMIYRSRTWKLHSMVERMRARGRE